jgi:hypothetical protein
MSGVTAPPFKPRPLIKTNKVPKYHYTIHSKPTDAFTLRANDRTAIVAFQQWDDAFMIGQMMENYFMKEREFPDISAGEGKALILPQRDTSKELLDFLYIERWDFDDLKMFSIKHLLSIISIQSLKETKNGYSLNGSVYNFEAPEEYYKLRFEELLPLNTDPDDGPY